MPRVNLIRSWLPLDATQDGIAISRKASTTPGTGCKLCLEHLPVAGFEFGFPVNAAPEMTFDLLVHVCGGSTDEALDDLGFGQCPPEAAEDLSLHPNNQALTIDQHTVAIEDDEVKPTHAT